MRDYSISVLAFAAAFGTVVAGSEALAQDATASTGVRQGVLEEIVVTARRRDERLQEVPLAVTAITAQSLRASGVSTTTQLTQAVPGFVAGRSTNNIQPVLRGVGTNYGGAGNESPVAFYIDGIYQPEPASNTIDLLNAERVEVLRGPQGTLFGRNATGGLVNIITPDPTFDPQAEVGVRYGSFQELSVKTYASMGFSDTVAVDIAAMAKKNDGHITDLLRGGKADALDSTAVRSKILLKPSDSFSAVITLNYAFLRDPGAASSINLTNNNVGRAINPNAPIGNYDLYVGDIKPQVKSSTRSASLRLKGDLGAVQLESTSSLAKYGAFNASDVDASAVPAQDVFITNYTKSYSQEFRLLSTSSETFKWTAGVYGIWNTVDQDFNIRQVIGAPRTILDPHLKTIALAGFAEGTLTLLENLKITAGGRYTSEKREFAQSFNKTRLFNVSTTFSKFTPRVIAQYVFSPKANVYASYSVGFKSGLYNTQGTSQVPVRPETNKAYEAGIKADPLPWLRTNLAAFWYDYTDLQVTVRPPGLGTSILQNSAAARMKGLEAEITMAPVANLELAFQGSLLDANYTKFENTLITVPLAAGGNASVLYDASGRRMLRAPKTSFNASAKYTIDLAGGEVVLRGSAYHSSKVNYTLDGRLFQPAYWLTNAQVAYVFPNGRTTLSAFVENIGDEHIADNILSTAAGDSWSFASTPRTFGVGLDMKF